MADKIEIMMINRSEVQTPPFPRSPEVIRSLAIVRGRVIGSPAAEAFVSLREIAWDLFIGETGVNCDGYIGTVS